MASLTALHDLLAGLDDVGHDDVLAAVLATQQLGKLSTQLAQTACNYKSRNLISTCATCTAVLKCNFLFKF